VTGSVRYGAWGEERASTGTMPTDRGYTGQLQADEVGLYFYNARWYDQELARFVEADSIVPDAGNAVSYDRYAYALNNPIRYNDPSGHWPNWFNPKGWLDYGMGAGSQFVDDMSFGLFSAITGDLDFVLNDTYQQGREAGRTASIVVSSVEAVLGTAAFLNGIGLIGPTAGGSLVAALPSGGTSLIFGGIAIPVELAAAGAGVVAAVHGIGMAVYIVNNPLQNSNENITIPQGKVNQVTRRGWSLEQIIEVQKNPTYTRSTANNPNVYNRANGNPVTYYYRSDGHYVVIDDITHQVVQVSNTHNPGWIDEMTNKPITRRVSGGTQ